MIVHTCATAIESVSIGGQLLYLSWIGFLFFILHKVAARSFPALCHLFISFCILVGSFDFPVSFFFFHFWHYVHYHYLTFPLPLLFVLSISLLPNRRRLASSYDFLAATTPPYFSMLMFFF